MQERADDCVRACLVSILEDDTLAEAPTGGKGWWHAYQDALDRHGVELLEGPPAIVKPGQDVRWIALVPSLHDPGAHAVVMRGRELEHDPGRRQPRYETGEQVMERALGSVLIVPRAKG
jgi:hypothetical protein